MLLVENIPPGLAVVAPVFVSHARECCYSYSFLVSLFFVGVEPVAVSFCVSYVGVDGCGAAARLGVAAVLLRFFQGEASEKHGAPAAVLVKAHDAIGAHIRFPSASWPGVSRKSICRMPGATNSSNARSMSRTLPVP